MSFRVAKTTEFSTPSGTYQQHSLEKFGPSFIMTSSGRVVGFEHGFMRPGQSSAWTPELKRFTDELDKQQTAQRSLFPHVEYDAKDQKLEFPKPVPAMKAQTQPQTFKVHKVTHTQNALGFKYVHYEITPRGSAVVCFGDVVCGVQCGAEDDSALALVTKEYRKQLKAWRGFRPKISYNEKDQTLTFLEATGKE